jgi:hypothetical protein
MGKYIAHSSSEIANQDYVAGDFALRQKQLLAVA